MGLFAFIFGAFIGGGGTYYYFRDKIEGGQAGDYGLSEKLVTAEVEVRSLKAELAACKQQLNAAQQEIVRLREPQEEVKPEAQPEPQTESPPEPRSEPQPEPSPPPEKVEKPVEPAVHPAQEDDLRKIQGIGPKVAQLLIASGILTYKQLADTSLERLREILDEAGSPFKGMNPENWPQQAAFAAKGDWEGLNAFQAAL